MTEVNVLECGAIGDRVKDCTNAFNAAALIAGEGGKIVIPPGRYLLSGTIHGLTNQIWAGAGCNSTTLVRQSDYGDTLSFTNALACSVTGMFFRHGTIYNSGDTELDFMATGASAHVRLDNAQGAKIEDCWMWRMPYGVVIEKGSLVDIHRNKIQGTWDHTDTALQEGIAAVLVGKSGYTQIVSIKDNYFGGSGSVLRDVTYTSTDTGEHIIQRKENIGGKNGVRVMQCEDLKIQDNYFGGHNASNLATALVADSVNLDWRITNNLIDAARNGACINILTASNGAYINGVIISNNVFNGEMQTYYGIVADNRLGDDPVITNFTIASNTFQAFVGTPMLMYHARGGNINNNTITGYNASGVSDGGDYTFSSAIYLSKKASHILCNANVIGGAVNSALPSAYCYNGIVKDASLPLPATIVDSNNLLIQ